ncbi:DNA (cytosine-5-)-methyltransferase [Bifidobacterium sp.]|uniref:DNA (cytosine-5-)-methyltransferase n=1 Tax=Bifidobacterium sp. TaxID=41200 RepID=UPI002A910F98|nr:DNA (cytosine-5-)-methyltransferase [Bifidobacterium sp.]MDY5367688.1 DNA (cytosine-5-)-methyltransferase [Bifidobacterium sp.]
MNTKLTVVRMQRGLTQKELAEAVGVPTQYISNLESGYRNINRIAFKTGVQIGKVLSVKDMDELLEDDPITESRIKTSDPLHEPQKLTASRREEFRRMANESREARRKALAGEGPEPEHPINVPLFDPMALMPQREYCGVDALSLFSGGGGLDLGFDLAGVGHAGSWEILEDAAATLMDNRPSWPVHGGADGDVRNMDWKQFRGNVGIVHGGPPCQPFSSAGRQRGASDPRDMWPEFVRCVLECKPDVFVAENVAALTSARFKDYVEDTILSPLQGGGYHVHIHQMQAYEYGVPQVRRRVLFFGFRTRSLEKAWTAPSPTHRRPGEPDNGLPETMGVRKALGLPDTGFDDVCPTLRSGLSGPRHTTSILSSVSAQKKYEALGLWPNGVAADREAAHRFVTKNGTFRLSVPDVQLIQGFPETWRFHGATYMKLGQIGNSVAPPVAYAAASSVARLFRK